MTRKLRNARKPLFALATAAALGFGLFTAVAPPASAAETMGPPVCPRTAVGKCNSLTQCQNTCANLGLDPTGARCDASTGVGCCYCPLIL